jgi:hypothetical protein
MNELLGQSDTGLMQQPADEAAAKHRLCVGNHSKSRGRPYRDVEDFLVCASDLRQG